MGDALKTFVIQLTKNADKQPGWVPLLLTVYEASTLLGLPNQLSAWMKTTIGQDLGISSVVIATVLTFVFYQVGDAMDKPLFEWWDKKIVAKRWPGWHKNPEENLEKTLGIKEGVYLVSKNLAMASKDYEKVSIQVFNEAA